METHRDRPDSVEVRPTQGMECDMTRRSFIKAAGLLVGGSAFAGSFFREDETKAANFGNPVLVETDPRVEIKYSVCLGCHGGCGIRCKVVDEVLVKIDGNPYHPNNLDPHLFYATDPEAAKTVPGRICAKGIAAIQSLYDPYRLKEPLKRVGPRGSGQWEAITWEAAFAEIGAKLAIYRDLSTPINPNAPELGPKVNQVVFSGGRNQQAQFTDRFWKKVFGTVNARHDHTSICEESHHVAHELLTGSGIHPSPKNHTKPDLLNSKFVLWFGSDPCSANFPFVPIARKLIEMVVAGGKLYVVDPRCNVAASKGTWIPVKPGTDAALALAIGRYIVDHGLYNESFLIRPHNGASNPTGELNVTDATLLVKIVSGRPQAFLRANEAGIQGGSDSDFVVWSNGAASKFDSVDTADLLPGLVAVSGIECKTAFELYVERVRENTIAEYSAICGVDQATIERLARELVAAGRQGCVTMYRGPVQHTNGTYTGLAILYLNLLIGNFNWKGGLSFGGGAYKATGGFTGAPFSDPGTVTGGVKEVGVPITRVKSKYEDSTEFKTKGYPAKRPWFPLAGHYNYQEIIPSIEDEYPYPAKALILYWNGIPYSTPAARDVYERVLADENKIELVVAIDIAMGEATAWADYVLPDTTYFERWSVKDVAPTILTKTLGVRQPVVGTFDADMNYTPYLPNTKTVEDMLIGLANVMGLPVGLQNAWDFYRQLIANTAADGEPLSMEYVVARGGRFEDYDKAYDGEKLARRFEDRLYFFSEKLAKTHDSMTGAYFDGVGKYEPPADVKGRVIEILDGAYPLQLVTYKFGWHTQMHTIRYPWLVSVLPANFVEISRADAAARDIRTGDHVTIESPSALRPLEGVAYVTDTIRPGVVGVSHHFGHWEMSSKPHQVNGVNSGFSSMRRAGITANPIMRSDPTLGNVTLQDKIGGSASFYDTYVQVAKA
ncbi:MAG: molybdopterin-dependent oxidoreductase [Candidatus Hydrogenedentes bacterium]|nr:molybdopterin-dependent oxidoreductase [Candidatus Hydrogenedentota bacterium]